jgi:hypothetical protein
VSGNNNKAGAVAASLLQRLLQHCCTFATLVATNLLHFKPRVQCKIYYMFATKFVGYLLQWMFGGWILRRSNITENKTIRNA